MGLRPRREARTPRRIQALRSLRRRRRADQPGHHIRRPQCGGIRALCGRNASQPFRPRLGALRRPSGLEGAAPERQFPPGVPARLRGALREPRVDPGRARRKARHRQPGRAADGDRCSGSAPASPTPHPQLASIQFTPHDFRRLLATDLANHGLSVHIGAALLGHLNRQPSTATSPPSPKMSSATTRPTSPTAAPADPPANTVPPPTPNGPSSKSTSTTQGRTRPMRPHLRDQLRT